MRSLTAGLVALVLVAGACSPAGGPAQPGGSSDDAWRTVVLQDVATGEEFTISDLRGKVVAIETMAIWCTTCRIQQHESQAALDQVNSPDVVYISLDVDANERAADLATYAANEGFTWRFAVSTAEMSRSLVATFGAQILSPPSTPLIVMGPDGTVVEQHVGITPAATLAALFEEHLP
jgi:thiol-disulfide isomerase/thioredoxin